MIDKDLFLHDLAIVAILKCEGPYLKEWIDYHLLAGVDHFYLYDNESPDNQAEVVKPYVEAGLVDYFPFPGNKMQYAAYNDAIRRFKFHCRYMAFIDGDEFIYPQFNKVDLRPVVGGGIIEIVDEILSHNWRAAGLAINWHIFGSNGQENADYSRGVLERFTHRAQDDYLYNGLIKTIANPRKVALKGDAHMQFYFESFYSINENGILVNGQGNRPITTKKIVINHYVTKSHEEYKKKLLRGAADGFSSYSKDRFDLYNKNEEFDDGILIYREERAKVYQPPDKSHANERLLSALKKILFPTLQQDTPQSFYANKMETFLMCRAVSSYLKDKLMNNAQVKFFEEASLAAILKSLDKMTVADAQLFVRELPNILSLPYPIVKEIYEKFIKCIPKIMTELRMKNGYALTWHEYVNMDYMQNLLKFVVPVIFKED